MCVAPGWSAGPWGLGQADGPGRGLMGVPSLAGPIARQGRALES